MSKQGEYCTLWTTDDHDLPLPLCRCPECKGLLPRDFPTDKPFRCKKCGVIITPIPGEHEDPESGFIVDGKLCVKPKHLRTEEEIKDQEDYKAQRQEILAERRANKKTKTIYLAFLPNTQRVVWKDRDGLFIEVYDYTHRGRMEIDDDRIIRVVNRETFKEISKQILAKLHKPEERL